LEHGMPTGISAASTATTTATPASTTTEDEDIQRAIQASLDEQNSSDKDKNKNTTPTTSRPPPTAAARKAGQAAMQRSEAKGNVTSNGTKGSAAVLIASHPQVKIPKRLSQHDKEDVILRCAARIAPHPLAVDTLLRSLKTIQAHPTNNKYQTIDTTTSGFQRSLNAPGVLDFLKAMNFHPQYQQPKTLKLAILDPATFYLGISALEQVQETSPEYANNKALLKFDKEVEQALLLANSDTKEAVKRADFMSKVPSESSTARGSHMTVEIGSNTKISRKFDGDDTLQDVVNWLGAHASIIPSNLQSGEWHLVDRNHPEALPYSNLTGVLDRTLQYIGCWPSGRLAVVPTLPHPTAVGTTTLVSSYRGLGAGPVEHLQK